MNLRVILIGIFVASVTALPTFAHELHVYVAADSGGLQGKAYFDDDAPAADLPVSVENAEGESIAELRTDADGTFFFVPSAAGPLTFVAATPDGHRETFEVGASEVLSVLDGPDALTERVDVDRLGSQIAALREQINALQERLWLRDVIGGIGYIFGVLGLIAWWKSRRPRA